SMTVIMTLLGTLLTSLVIAREHERGTLEALYATALTRGQILIGKTLPYFLLAMVSMAVCVLTALLLFQLPLRGSFLTLGLVSAVFLVPALGQGLLISVTMRTQMAAAQLGLMTGYMPAMMLSGFLFDIRSMPPWLQVITLAIVDLDRGPYAADVEQRLSGSRSFTRLPRYANVAGARVALDREQVVGILVLPSGFSPDLAAGRPASAQLLLDGRRSNAAQITAQYVSNVLADEGAPLSGLTGASEALSTATSRAGAPGTTSKPNAEVVIDNWFNPNLDYQWFMLPNL